VNLTEVLREIKPFVLRWIDEAGLGGATRLENVGFEDGELEPWEVIDEAGDPTIVTDSPRTGTYCLRVTGLGSGAHGIVSQGRFPVEGGEQLTYGYCYRMEAGATVYAYLQVNRYDADGNLISAADSSSAPSTTWRQRAVTVTLPANARWVDYVLGTYEGNEGEYVWFDDLRLYHDRGWYQEV
jgi:hypothetical protein